MYCERWRYQRRLNNKSRKLATRVSEEKIMRKKRTAGKKRGLLKWSEWFGMGMMLQFYTKQINIETNLFLLRGNVKANYLLRETIVMHNLLAESLW